MLRFFSASANQSTVEVKYPSLPGQQLCIYDVRCDAWDFKDNGPEDITSPEAHSFNYGAYVGYLCSPHAAFDVAQGNVSEALQEFKVSCDLETSANQGTTVVLPECMCKAID